MVAYESKITELGEKANHVESDFFEPNMMIFFGDSVPETLKQYCYSLNTCEINSPIKKGMHLNINDDAFEILYVGRLVESNLRDLAHVTVVFTDYIGHVLPGQIVVKGKRPSEVKIGDTISITE